MNSLLDYTEYISIHT